jgi:hypothetical protein
LRAGLRYEVSLLVAATAARAAPAGIHDDEDDRDSDRYENCPENEPVRPAPTGAPVLLFSVCAHAFECPAFAESNSAAAAIEPPRWADDATATGEDDQADVTRAPGVVPVWFREGLA